jgi:hypothetical protein
VTRWPRELRFAFVKGDKSTQFPPLAPVYAQRKRHDAWADLIAGWLVQAWAERAALEITNWPPRDEDDGPRVRAVRRLLKI